MGVNIYVGCNCYKNGLCSEPLVDKSLILLDDSDGYYFYYLNLTYSGNEDINLLYDEWVENACSHKNMECFSEHLGTNRIVAKIIDFIYLLGDKFSFVYDNIPKIEGSINPEKSKKILECLKEINSEKDIQYFAEINNIQECKDYNDNLYSKLYPRFDEMLSVLKKGCQASIETGNPLVFS